MTCRRLSLADGCHWTISAENPAAGPLVARLGQIMQLPAPADPPPAGRQRQLSLAADGVPKAFEASFPQALQAARRGEPAHCALETEGADEDLLFALVMQLTTLFGAVAQQRGGALVHGALALIPGASRDGILLAAPGGAGKTTASSRLPPPWVSLCDDTALVVRDLDGMYWAHPWPTWSLCVEGGPGGHWNVPSAVPLRAIFQLKQASCDSVAPLGAGQAAARLMQAAEEASPLAASGLAPEQVRPLRLQRFDWLSGLAHAVPVFTLELSLTGAFWQIVEKALGWDTRLA